MPFTNKQISTYWPSVLLLFLFITEGYFKIANVLLGYAPSLLIISKALLIVVIVFLLVFKNLKSIFFPSLLISGFVIGQLTISFSIKWEIVLALGKYMFLLLLLIFFTYYKLEKSQKELLFLTFNRIMIFNSILIVIGVCFHIHLFQTYNGERFGYSGLLVSSATASYFYFIALIYLFLYYGVGLFKNPFNILIFLAAFLVGTKALYLFLTFFSIVFIFTYFKREKLLASLSILLFGSVFFYYLFFVNDLFNGIRVKASLLTSILSYRDQLFLNETLPYIKSNWNALNYLFGGVTDIKTRSQMELVDIFYFFGIIGGLLYLYTFKRFFLQANLKRTIKVLLLLTFGIILFAGNFFGYASVAIYVVVLSEFLKENERDKSY